MSRENVELVGQMYESYLQGDMERALAYFHPDVKVDLSVRVDTAVGKGREELGRVVGSWVGTWDGYSETLDELRDLGDKVCVVGTQRGRGKGSGVELAQRFAGLYEVRDGLITSLTMYGSVDEAIAATPDSP
jgi:ketosteroid isomerase-like protein